MVLNSGTHPCYMFLVFHRRMSTLQPVNRCLQKYPNIEGLAVRNYQVVQTWTFCCPTFNLMFSWNKQCLRKITWGIQNPPCSQHCHCSAWIPLDSFYQCVSSHRHNFCNLFFLRIDLRSLELLCLQALEQELLGVYITPTSSLGFTALSQLFMSAEEQS